MEQELLRNIAGNKFVYSKKKYALSTTKNLKQNKECTIEGA
jgi:hypothetical protein